MTRVSPLPWRTEGDTLHDSEGMQVADFSFRVRGAANARLAVAAIHYLEQHAAKGDREAQAILNQGGTATKGNR